ncbi:hypothetical protein ACWC5I_16550 [Kitasatospora sp. NPDC001574]
MQATLGLINESVRAIAVQVDAGRIILHFSVMESSPELDEDIDDIKFELDAFLEGKLLIGVQVYVGPPDAKWVGRSYRLIYLENYRIAQR